MHTSSNLTSVFHLPHSQCRCHSTDPSSVYAIRTFCKRKAAIMYLLTTASPDYESLKQLQASKSTSSRNRCLATGLALSVVLATVGGILFQIFRSFDQGVLNTCYGRYESTLLAAPQRSLMTCHVSTAHTPSKALPRCLQCPG